MRHSMRVFVAVIAGWLGMESAVHAEALSGTYISSSMYSCRYTAEEDKPNVAATQMQTQAVTGYTRYTPDGKVSVDVMSSTYGVVLSSNPASGTRGMTHALCEGTYWSDADGSFLSDVACTAHPVNADGTDNLATTIDVPSILGRSVKAGNELYRMPLRPPVEETVYTTTGSTTTKAYRKCTRTGTLRKIGD